MQTNVALQLQGLLWNWACLKIMVKRVFSLNKYVQAEPVVLLNKGANKHLQEDRKM